VTTITETTFEDRALMEPVLIRVGRLIHAYNKQHGGQLPPASMVTNTILAACHVCLGLPFYEDVFVRTVCALLGYETDKIASVITGLKAPEPGSGSTAVH